MTLLASLALVAWLKKTTSIVYDTPKVRQKKNLTFGGVFIIKLTYEDKI